jgi:glycosyltransferase involved in cell wall biosynthesis
MRIGMFTSAYPPSQGGLEASVFNLSKGLKDAGHEVFVFAPNYPNWEEKEENVFRYDTIPFFYRGIQYVIPTLFQPKIEEKVNSLGLDVIHSNHPFLVGSDALKYSQKLDIPIVMTYHSKYEDQFYYIPLLPEFISRRIAKKVVHDYCRKCDAIIAPSSAIKKIIIENQVKKPVYVIPSGINVDRFNEDTGKREFVRNKYNIKENEILLVTACRLAKEKNVDFLVRAFKFIHDTKKNVKLMIIGDGAVKEEIEQEAKDLGLEDSVIFTGFLATEDMASHYQAGDIFVFASLTETQGLVAVEAMAAGLPVVAIKASGIEDMVKNGNDGILTDNDEQNFADNAIKLIEDGDLRKKMSENAKLNSEEFSIKPWVNKVANLYKDLIEKRKNS